MVHRNFLEEAKPLVEQAVQEGPKLAVTHEALGVYEFRTKDYTAAEAEMAKAIELGSTNFIAFYCQGAMRLRELVRAEESTREASELLEKAAKLNPEFAPTFEALTQAYSRSTETQGKALEAAQRAVTLDPGSRSYKNNLIYVLLNNGRAAEAKTIAQRLMATASSEEEVEAARRLTASVEEELEWEQESAEEANSATGAADAVKAHPAMARRQLGTPEWMAVDGVISTVECGKNAEVTMTLSLEKGPMVFHAADFRKIGVSGVSQEETPDVGSCKAWSGRRVKVWFRWVQGQDYVGEMIKIYFH
jgi:tetratricopeptide (TPR) repeat protein